MLIISSIGIIVQSFITTTCPCSSIFLTEHIDVIELDKGVKDNLSHRMQIVSDSIKEQPEISITYFKPDERKNGGEYIKYAFKYNYTS